MSTATLPQTKNVVFESDQNRQIIAPHQTVDDANALPHKWLISAQAYMRMAEVGLFEGQHVELIAGDIIAMPPISEPHAQSVDKTTQEA